MTNRRGGRDQSKGYGGEMRTVLCIFMKMSLCNPELSVYNYHILKEGRVKTISIGLHPVQ